MEFDAHKPIYLQIADSICDKILSREMCEDERIASVREYGAELGVNPNTVMRTYEYLQNIDIIYNKRGIGYFVSPNAVSTIRSKQKREFIDSYLPQLQKKITLLNISVDELSSILKNME